MKILFVSSECAPFSKSGGLADVAFSLPPALQKTGDDMAIVTPMYRVTQENYGDEFERIKTCQIALGQRRLACSLYRGALNGVPVYAIGNEHLFHRPRLYGYGDDSLRFAFFCRAVIDLLPEFGALPDILHCNDWETALAILYLKNDAVLRPELSHIKTVYTIHNIAYQGQFGRSEMEATFALPDGWYHGGLSYEFEGRQDINLMKGAMLMADAVTTVSPTYARELHYPYFAHGLQGVVDLVDHKLYGILNGIDTSYYDPANDPELFAAYSAEDPAGKAVNKAELQRMLSLPESPDTPLFAIVSRLADHKGLDLVALAADDILEGDVQLIVLGKGEYYYENFFYHLAQRYPNKVSALLVYNKDLSKKVYAGADMFLMPSKTEPCGLSQMIASRYGAVPIVRETGGLYDSIRDCGWPEGGNGFTFAPYSAWELLGAVRRAEKMYTEQPEQWCALRHTAMTCDFTWNRSALQYIELYGELN